MFFIGQTDGRSTQNYSSEPHKTSQNGRFEKLEQKGLSDKL